MTPTRFVDCLFDQVTTQEDVAFRTARNERGEGEVLRLDVYLPAGDDSAARPAILWIHGGGFRPGNDKRQGYIVRMATAFARRGYACFACDYRVREQPQSDMKATVSEAVDDCRAALGWIREQAETYGVDPRRVAVAGGSAGGMIGVNLCALERSPSVFAFVDLWGSPWPDAMLTPIDRHFPPTVIVHGTADQLVPYERSEELARTLEEKGVRCLLHTIPDAPHTPVAHMDAFAAAVAGFLYAALPGERQ